jgi:cytochrome c peroxidase
MLKIKLVVLWVLIIFLSSCGGYRPIDPELDLGQNWGVADQKEFYQTTQGSQIINYIWFLALEQPNTQTAFLEDKLHRFGYLPDLFSSGENYNPDGLPVGFVRDDDEKGAWIGMTCAACHTSEIIVDNKAFRVDGGATDADFYRFIEELGQTLLNTANDDEKFSRFAEKVKIESTRLEIKFDGTTLRGKLKKEAERFTEFVARSTPDEPWGKARLDAFGLILNEVAFHLYPVQKNLVTPNAPVSYPFIWDIHQQPRVQWNGISSGALSRNTTEVLGVFAKFDAESPSNNTVQIGNLKKLEGLVEQLRSPQWKNFKMPDGISEEERKKRLEKGAVLYKERCQSCHRFFDRDEDQVKEMKVVLNPINNSDDIVKRNADTDDVRPINTDEVMAMSFYERRIFVKEGEKEVKVGVVKALRGLLLDIWFKSLSGLFTGIVQALTGESIEEVRVYKARPLNGVWATAPYLHNGSIPNMTELLKFEDDRVKNFCVGSRDFDPEHLGFDSIADPIEGCGDNFKFDTTLPGNSNKGHNYGTEDLEEEDRLAIIEFIKWE